MSSLTAERKTTPSSFIIDRLTRIVPVYWLVTLATVVSYRMHLLNPSRYTDDNIHLLSSLLFIPRFNAAGDIFPTLYLGWTLNYEMFFYVLFACVLFADAGIRMYILTAIMTCLVVAGFFIEPTSAAGMTYTNPLILEFLAGSLLGMTFGISLQRHVLRACMSRSVLILAAIIGCSAFFPGLRWGAFCVAVVMAALLVEKTYGIRHIKLLLVLGNASFSIYMFQEMAFDVTDRLFDGVNVHALKILSAGMAVCLGVCAWKWVEVPLTRMVRESVRGMSLKREVTAEK